jgi:soluble lytic murein transglycosylase
MRPYALRRSALLFASLGDTLRAEATWSSLIAVRSPWQWEAARARSDLVLARGDATLADTLLEQVDRRAWPDADRGEWLARRVGLRVAMGDSTGAIELCRQVLKRYPAHPRAPEALATLADLLAAQGDSLRADDEWLASQVEQLRGRQSAALDCLSRFVSKRAAPPGFEVEFRRVTLNRSLRRFPAAQQAVAGALRSAASRLDSARVLLERARVLRDMGEADGALRAYRAAAARDPGTSADAWWERGRLLEDRGEWKAARTDYARVVAIESRRRDDAVLRAGLMSLAAGEDEAALDWLARSGSEGATFWRAIVLRRKASAIGDSLLRTIAERPGYTFYRIASRESLGVRGWPAVAAEAPSGASEPALGLAEQLTSLGLSNDAAIVLSGWAAGDSRLATENPMDASASRVRSRSPGTWLLAASIAFAGGNCRLALRLADRALSAMPDSADRVRWSVTPWLYPPAYDSLFAAYPESASAGVLDRSLLRAVAWKESRFDPTARSRSDAVGLLQLKRAAVSDVAGWLRETVPSDSALEDPALNLRYGAQYLQRMITRFHGDLPMALAAYNAGPGTAAQWGRFGAIAGHALACEEIDRPETQDYVKTILAVRQAYRELRPE